MYNEEHAELKRRLRKAGENKMSRAYEEIVDFIAGGATSDAVAHFEASDEVRSRVADLIYREKNNELSSDDRSELDQFIHLEHVMRLAKARARKRSH